MGKLRPAKWALNLYLNPKTMQDTKMQGVIKNLNEKGFGFIMVDGQEKDLFFHAKDVRDTSFNDLKKGMAVTFETESSDRGPKATNVMIAASNQE